MSEADLKRTCEDYLQLLQNGGKLIFLRLNSGNLVVSNPDGSYRRRIRGCPSGTADYIIIRSCLGESCILRIVDFIELKSVKGRQSPDQLAFEDLVTKQGCGYHIVRTLEELQLIITISQA
mgnify:CR=1 FL=1